MVLEETRFLHEDIERLEQAISDRTAEEPRHVRDRLARDHEVAEFLNRIQDQSKRLLEIYNDTTARTKEIQAISVGDPFDEFYKQLGDIKDFHRRYPNENVENLERAYKRKVLVEGEDPHVEIDNLFTGEEAFGRFLDLTQLHEAYLNVPGARRIPYLQYLDVFASLAPPQTTISQSNKETDRYFQYVGHLASYLEGFVKRTKPMEDLDKLFATFDADFTRLWDAKEMPGWNTADVANGSDQAGDQDKQGGQWCSVCGKDFKNENVYKAHLTGKKHLKNLEAQQNQTSTNGSTLPAGPAAPNAVRIAKQRAIAEREHRITSLAEYLSATRSATRINVERRQGMTERERQQELEALYAEAYDAHPAGGDDSDADSDSSEKIYNPLKLPLGWDGKPIPYWLYKLHGLGVEFNCEICGNYVYMGRRAFDKHFSESRHVYGLKCLGITNTSLFREITGIQEALQLWNKMQADKKSEASRQDMVQMEDAEGNVMPEKVYYDLQKQGLL